MERAHEIRGAAPSLFQCEPYQRPLFSPEAIQRTGRPSLIEFSDSHRTDRKRTLVAASPRTSALLDVLERAAPTTGTILLQGESGSGKNLLANFVHSRSRRSDGPFIQFSA